MISIIKFNLNKILLIKININESPFYRKYKVGKNLGKKSLRRIQWLKFLSIYYRIKLIVKIKGVSCLNKKKLLDDNYIKYKTIEIDGTGTSIQ